MRVRGLGQGVASGASLDFFPLFSLIFANIICDRPKIDQNSLKRLNHRTSYCLVSWASQQRGVGADHLSNLRLIQKFTLLSTFEAIFFKIFSYIFTSFFTIFLNFTYYSEKHYKYKFFCPSLDEKRCDAPA